METVHWLFLGVLLGNLLDSITTVRGLRRGCREMNPFFAVLFAKIGVYPALALKLLIAVICGWGLVRAKSVVGLATVTVLLLAVAVSNAWQGRRRSA